MKDIIILEGKNYISAKRAAKIINYAQDYIGQLCRAGKLDCKMVGRSWFVTEESLLAHRENAIDSTLDKSAKSVRITQETIETVKEALEEKVPDTPIISPIQEPLKYQVETRVLLPELTKKLPTTFALPKTITEFQAPQFTAPRNISTSGSTASLPSTVNPFTTALIVALIAVTGLLFTLSIASFKSNNSVAYGTASVRSGLTEVFVSILDNLGIRPRTSPLAKMNSAADGKNSFAGGVGTSTTGMTEYNGISVIPSTNPTADEAAKQRIINTFSDEVTIKPDKSGTAGVITPVFRKNTGEDFVYVLVPVKEKKE